ncbi:uncharacterized protein DS421_17g587980 [Arachis hypogaea]|nr:uncharacterized protein DS421_17g587980 [Arachis hypogaea]
MASPSSKRRKGKQLAEPPTYDKKRFKSHFHELNYHGWMENKEVIPEIGFRLQEGEYPIMREVIEKRRWEFLCDPEIDISATLVREFYANAISENKTSPPYKSYVRGIEVDFSPATIMRVLQIRAIPFREPSFEERMKGKNDPDEIVNDICLECKDWVRDSNNNPCHLKRIDLSPECKGWAGVLFENQDTDWVKEGKPITKMRMDNVSSTQGERRPQRRRRETQLEEGQASSTIDLSQIQSAIKRLSQQYMRAQEQQQEQYKESGAATRAIYKNDGTTREFLAKDDGSAKGFSSKTTGPAQRTI